MVRVRRVPQRTCIGCRQVRQKRELVRIVRTPEGEVVVDLTGKKAGRGAYICSAPACLEAALRAKQLERALNTSISPEKISALRQELGNIV
ncbi:MAG TPA: YlxR family protein [Firmicutes bacterium]|nr:YlxR family protein [Bacillota bacterium]